MASFPQYRKYKNNKSYFKILSEQEFYEIQLQRNQKNIYHVKVKILPDRNYLQDMLHNYTEYWDKCDKNEIEFIETHLKTNS
ncbi:MAG: hypothetical protein HND27_03030 [Bacteroidetes bacterium]|nr:hypothetical protein [Bacteroidota bacterium]MBV6460750.1 hypothetical protein [Flavobacteriales bacterium]WKZ75746.1 MAG: hypothetical protein QY303_02395 [Vicingaceae bacterium]MCL4817316.1 hypothetical protein [Flavobacteriales bacterium]NOG94734.1 hypothetical protein [Bacteroidota bacterium]